MCKRQIQQGIIKDMAIKAIDNDLPLTGKGNDIINTTWLLLIKTRGCVSAAKKAMWRTSVIYKNR